MNQLVASTTLRAKRGPHDKDFHINVEIGTPYQVEGEDGTWACPVRLRPLYQDLRDAHAGDSVQALCLAMALVIDLLAGFTEKGGELYFENGERFPLEAYCFGAALDGGNAA